MFGGAGMGAQRVSWQIVLSIAMAGPSKQEHLQTWLDLVKAFFETIPHDPAAKAAKQKGYGVLILRLSMAAYRMWRAVGTEEFFFAHDPSGARHHRWIMF